MTSVRVALFASMALLPCLTPAAPQPAQDSKPVTIPLADYLDRLAGFWLGQSIANWTGLVTEMDKIGGPGPHGQFYTREDWGQPDQPSIWGAGVPSDLSATIDWVFEPEGGLWGADDDTDIEYLYQQLMLQHQTPLLSAEQIRDGWLAHIHSDESTPHRTPEGEPENYLWVSNQRAFELMQQGQVPPHTSDPEHNPHHQMIDAQLSTELFGLLAPGRPDVALQLAYLPIRTTARGEAALAAEFYIILHALAPVVDPSLSRHEQILWMAAQGRAHLPDGSTVADMYDFVWRHYQQQTPWESVRDALHQRYQVEQQAGYRQSGPEFYCNGCFASGINFAASLVSLFYGEGDYQATVKLAVLMGWDSDNPAATWGGLLGFMDGQSGLEAGFERRFADRFHIHRTRRGFANQGIDSFDNMARQGSQIIDWVVRDFQMGEADSQGWRIFPSSTMADK
ncbi:ADP-ribosylglycohydrolase family protein [Ferrimonas marina]|uniref:ADP-ribosylglycohydrolase n=1 Tax=Ferrimonas marina TaxID=299255 RepID=A0A1M5VSU1_9GAMM|nr:ADP-ribosylglycohydrolase family protein [Ferrimonas marina]SHH78260.1 ADP-ribosylglycohydrolase [Ferrimonas marina]